MAEEKQEPTPRRRREDQGLLPPWAKLAIAVIGTTVTTIVTLFLYVSSTFVSRVEYLNHAVRQAEDMARLEQTQRAYALAERETANGLSDLKVDVGEIKSDVSWLRAYLDVSQPPPRKNGNGKKP